MLGNKLLNIRFAKYHIWNNKSEGFPNMVLSTETFNQSVRTEYSEAVNARFNPYGFLLKYDDRWDQTPSCNSKVQSSLQNGFRLWLSSSRAPLKLEFECVVDDFGMAPNWFGSIISRTAGPTWFCTINSSATLEITGVKEIHVGLICLVMMVTGFSLGKGVTSAYLREKSKDTELFGLVLFRNRMLYQMPLFLSVCGWNPIK